MSHEDDELTPYLLTCADIVYPKTKSDVLAIVRQAVHVAQPLDVSFEGLLVRSMSRINARESWLCHDEIPVFTVVLKSLVQSHSTTKLDFWLYLNWHSWR